MYSNYTDDLHFLQWPASFDTPIAEIEVVEVIEPIDPGQRLFDLSTFFGLLLTVGEALKR